MCISVFIPASAQAAVLEVFSTGLWSARMKMDKVPVTVLQPLSPQSHSTVTLDLVHAGTMEAGER
jgi:hypothetical protein